MTTTLERPALYTMDVVADNGTPFRVVAIPPQTVGPNPGRANGRQGYAMVEFYDRRHPHTEHGQFTGGYYDLVTVSEGTRGLCLAGGVDAWTVDAITMAVVRQWLETLFDNGALGDI